MHCGNCNTRTSHILVDRRGRESCHNCGGFSEASGKSISGAITRNSFRVRRQQDHHEGDFVQPHKFDKTKRRLDINPDFVKLYPDQAATYFSDGEMKSAGYSKLPEHSRKVAEERDRDVAREVEHDGSVDDGVKRLLGE